MEKGGGKEGSPPAIDSLPSGPRLCSTLHTPPAIGGVATFAGGSGGRSIRACITYPDAVVVH